jgi:PKD repeat protein
VMDTHAILINEVPISGLSASNDSPTVLVNPTTFTATVTAGTNVSFAWDFGDDATGSGAVTTHTYASAGVYTATVSANNSASVITATTQVTIVTPSYPLYLPNILKEQQVGGLIEAVITTQGYAIHYPTDYFTYGYVCNLTTEPLYDVIIQFEVTWHSYNDPTGHIEIFKVTPALTATLPG